MVNEWLRFAEAKNAGLLGLSGLSLTAVLGFVAQVEGFGRWSGGMLLGGIVLWLVSILITAVSFLPRTDLLNISSRLEGTPEASDNLYYYGHLAKLDVQSLLGSLGINSNDQSPRYRFEKNLAEQVIANSRITTDKLHAFELATKIWMVGLVPTTGSVLTVLLR